MPLDVGCLGGGGPTLAITQGYAGVRVRIPDAGRAGPFLQGECCASEIAELVQVMPAGLLDHVSSGFPVLL